MEEVRDVHTKGGRMWLFEALNEARRAAKDCGVDDKAGWFRGNHGERTGEPREEL